MIYNKNLMNKSINIIKKIKQNKIYHQKIYNKFKILLKLKNKSMKNKLLNLDAFYINNNKMKYNYYYY